ncbi:MAG: F0F1 ATP synthase subunit epsilon [Phycisphaerales bacterium]|nr:F0F1 ATP synthase subunit epsilon [Phycisphaerales bacterium]
MAQKTFNCRLVTPTASLVNGPVTYASVPAWDGLFGVLPGRAPILTRLGTGELHLEFPDTGGGKGGGRSFLIEGGFVRMANNELTILTERATPAETITETDAEAELKAALARTVPDDAANRTAQLEKIQRDQQRARAKLTLARAKKGI